MIKTISVYEVNGKRFDNLGSAIQYEMICEEVESIMSRLKPRTKDVEDGLDYIQQDKNVLKSCKKDFYELCSQTIPDFANMFIEVGKGERHPSHIERVLSEYENDYPCLWKAHYRFKCIDEECGYEFQQSYYATHVKEGLANIEKRKEYLKKHGRL